MNTETHPETIEVRGRGIKRTVELVATSRDGSALYEDLIVNSRVKHTSFRAYRRAWYRRDGDGRVRPWTKHDSWSGRYSPQAAPEGRWRWVKKVAS